MPLPETAADAWARHLPWWVSRLLAPSVVVVAIVWSTVVDDDSDTVTAAEATSLAYLSQAVVLSALVAAVLLLVILPSAGERLGLGAAAVIAGFDDGAPRLAWCVVTALLAVLVVLRVHQRALQQTAGRAAPGGTTAWRRPEVDGDARSVLLALDQRWVGLAGAALVVAAIGGGLYVHDVVAVQSFRASAAVAAAVVTSSDDDAARVTIGDRAYAVPWSVREPKAGETVEVRYDPDGSRAELTDDVFDPTLALLPFVGGGLLGAAALAHERRRRAAIRVLLDDGGPAWVVRASRGRHDAAVSVAPCGDPTRPFARLGPFVPGSLGETLPPADEVPSDLPPAASLSDAELLEVARHGPPPEGVNAAPSLTPPPWAGATVTIVGLGDDTRPVALHDGTRWWVSPQGARTVTTRGGAAVATTRRSAPSTPAPPLVTSDSGPAPESGRPSTDGVHRRGASAAPGRATSSLGGLVRRTGPWLSWPAAWLVAVPLGWLFAGGDVAWWHMIVPVGLLWRAGRSWALAWVRPLSVRPAGLVARGPWSSELVPWREITAVVADERALVVRLDDALAGEGDALLFAAGDDGAALLAGARSTEDARDRIEAARSAALPDAHAARGRRRPSLVLLAGAWWAAAAALAVVAVGTWF
jgi:hypothetical protein